MLFPHHVNEFCCGDSTLSDLMNVRAIFFLIFWTALNISSIFPMSFGDGVHEGSLITFPTLASTGSLIADRVEARLDLRMICTILYESFLKNHLLLWSLIIARTLFYKTVIHYYRSMLHWSSPLEMATVFFGIISLHQSCCLYFQMPATDQ